MPPEIGAGSFPAMVDVVIVGGRGSRNGFILAVFYLIRIRHDRPQRAGEPSSAVGWSTSEKCAERSVEVLVAYLVNKGARRKGSVLIPNTMVIGAAHFFCVLAYLSGQVKKGD